jgi:hypothetical protein
MNAEKSENASDGSNGRTLKIRVAAAGTLKESGQLRSAGPVSQEARNLEVARIATNHCKRRNTIWLFSAGEMT